MQYLLDLDRLLSADKPLEARLDNVAASLGNALPAQRVVIYGDSASDDVSVRVRVEWSRPGRRPIGPTVTAVPLLTQRPMGEDLVIDAPRGSWCPSDCDVAFPGCVLRTTCSTIVQPLRVGQQRYGALAVHDRTGTSWSDEQRLLVRQTALLIALQIAAERQTQLESELDAQRQGIAHTALHQLATPVTILTGVVDHLQTRGGDEDPWLAVAADECDRLRRLCDDLAALAPAAAAPEEVTCQPDRVIEQALDAARRAHPQATLTSRIVGELPPVRCEARQLERALLGVIDNSVRYTTSSAHIELDAWCTGDRVVLRLRDDGPGITAVEAQLLGEPFARLDPDMRIAPGGAGLGLAIARRAARAGGGDLIIEPRSDSHGTQITIVLATAGSTW